MHTTLSRPASCNATDVTEAYQRMRHLFQKGPEADTWLTTSAILGTLHVLYKYVATFLFCKDVEGQHPGDIAAVARQHVDVKLPQ